MLRRESVLWLTKPENTCSACSRQPSFSNMRSVAVNEAKASRPVILNGSLSVRLSEANRPLFNMATLKFREESPFKSGPIDAPNSDAKYLRYMKESASLSNGRLDNGGCKIDPVSVALFGVGRMGLIHLNNLINSQYFRLAYIVDENRTKLGHLRSDLRLKDCVILQDSECERVFSDQNVEAVCIATPSYTHVTLVTRALKSHKAVLCEKPLAEDEKGTLECYKVAQENGRPLMCAFNRRFDPTFSDVRTRVLRGEVGEVHRIKTVSRDSPLPGIEYLKISGGIFHDCVIHDIDLICHILGEYPVKVYASASAFIPEIRELGDHDTVALNLEFPSGAIGTVDISRNSVYGYDQRLEVFGPKGMIRSRNEKPSQAVLSSRDAEAEVPIFHSFPSRYQRSYERELDHFYDLVRGHATDEITKETTLKASRIASAAEKSAKTGVPVEISYDFDVPCLKNSIK